MPRSSRSRLTAAVAAGALLSPLTGPVLAARASTPTVPPLPLAALAQALEAAGVPAAQVSALESQLATLQSTGSATGLAASLTTVLGELPIPSAISSVLQGILGPLEGLLPLTPTPSAIDSIIAQLDAVASDASAGAPTEQAAAELGSALTTADLQGILGQTGSPLSSAQVATILPELAALTVLPAGGTVPAGSLSAVVSALQSLAGSPGVPSSAASSLRSAAAALADPSGVSPAALGGAIATLSSTSASLPAPLGPIVGSLVTEIAGSTTLLSSGGTGTTSTTGSTGSPGSAGTSGTAGAPGSGAGQAYVQWLLGSSQAGRTAATGAAAGNARVLAVRASHGRVRVTLSCPASSSGCYPLLSVRHGSHTLTAKIVSVAAGHRSAFSLRVPRSVRRGATLRVMAQTGTARSTRSVHAG